MLIRVGRGQFGTERKQLALNLAELSIHLIGRALGTDHAQSGVQLIDRAIGFDSSIVLRDSRPAKQSRGARVAGSGVNFHKTVMLMRMTKRLKQL
jgi:hypothetical protein